MLKLLRGIRPQSLADLFVYRESLGQVRIQEELFGHRLRILGLQTERRRKPEGEQEGDEKHGQLGRLLQTDELTPALAVAAEKDERQAEDHGRRESAAGHR